VDHENPGPLRTDDGGDLDEESGREESKLEAFSAGMDYSPTEGL